MKELLLRTTKELTSPYYCMGHYGVGYKTPRSYDDLLNLDMIEEQRLKAAYNLPISSSEENKLLIEDEQHPRHADNFRSFTDYVRNSLRGSPQPHNSEESFRSPRAESKLHESSGLKSWNRAHDLYFVPADMQKHTQKLNLIKALHVRHNSRPISAHAHVGQHLVPTQLTNRPHSATVTASLQTPRFNSTVLQEAPPASPLQPRQSTFSRPKSTTGISLIASQDALWDGESLAHTLSSAAARRSCAAVNAELLAHPRCAFLLRSGMCMLHGRSVLNRAFLERAGGTAYVRQQAAQAAALRREKEYRDGAEIGTRARRLRLRLASTSRRASPCL